MFSHIDLANIEHSELFGYAKDTAFFKKRGKIEFKPGLNIIVGPNGAGKSTIMKMLSHSMCAYQGGFSKITQSAINDLVDWGGSNREPKDKIGLEIGHDGQPVLFCDPRAAVGLIGGAFDDDFFQQGVAEVTSLNRISHGQQAMARINRILTVIMGDAAFPTKVEGLKRPSTGGKQWDILENRLKGTIEKGQATILLDEPESNYSLMWQMRLWSILADSEKLKNFQVIVASHSAFSLGIKGANYIDLVPGYRDEIELYMYAKYMLDK